MTLKVHWFLPTSGDSRDIVGAGIQSGDAAAMGDLRLRPPSIDYLALLAQTAEQLGFEAVLTPTGANCEDAWITTAALTQRTTKLKFLVAFRPGLITPTLAAHQAATYQRISGGRLLLNVVTGGDPVEQRRFGDHLSHDERYERTDEFLGVFRGISDPDDSAPLDHEGRHFRIEGGHVDFDPWERPAIFFGGASPAAERVAARHADVYLAWGETPEQIRSRLDRMRALAASEERQLSFGIRLHVISRDTSAEAWAAADKLLAGLTSERIAAAQATMAQTESVGQQRMVALHGGDRQSLEISPNLWAGYGLVRGGAGTALVGSHEEVADRIAEYHELGLDHFILSGQPHLEEAFNFGEGAAEVLVSRGLLKRG